MKRRKNIIMTGIHKREDLWNTFNHLVATRQTLLFSERDLCDLSSSYFTTSWELLKQKRRRRCHKTSETVRQTSLFYFF